MMPTADRPVPVTRDDLQTPVQYVKGVGPHKAEILKKLGIHTVEDVLYYFPRTHQDRRIVPIRSLLAGHKQTIIGTVVMADFKRVGKMLGQARAVIKDESGTCEAVWFKYHSYKYDVFSGLKRDLVPGNRVLVYGMVEPGPVSACIKAEDQEIFNPENIDSSEVNRWVPIYPRTEGVSDRWLRQLAMRLVPTSVAGLVDPVPASLRDSQKLIDLSRSIRQYHFPENAAERDEARERLAFDEFFMLEVALALNRQNREQHAKGFTFVPKKNLLTPFRKSLAYEFTKAQGRVINEIFRDMERPFPMNRLLQGDVGSGKTVVALSAALLAIENGCQVAFLAPTEILASQHFLTMSKFLQELPVRTELLTGSTPSAERKKILKDLAAGKIQLLIGTHAILNDAVQFQKLGLAVIDEQHRFGVRQRAKLAMKTTAAGATASKNWIEQIQPDILIMTATPIPRTLAMTLYGDLEVSVLDESPPGRAPIQTKCFVEGAAMQRIESVLAKGQQAYVVFPLVDGSESLSKRNGKIIQAATKEFERIKQRFSKYTVGLLHGQMDADEKKQVMSDFRSGKVQLLVATPVIEVGIDVPNATVIAIVNPERFGLSQLHQLRGRVGRGTVSSECILVVDPLEEGIAERLAIFCGTLDGFKLAEEDLRMRGPGEFMGEAQHGVPFFRVGDLLKDGLLIARARQAADSLVSGDLALTMKEFGLLNHVLIKRFGTKLHLSRIG